MNTRPLVLSFAAAAALVAAVMLLAVLLPPPEGARGADLKAPALVPSVKLAPGAGKPSSRSVKAHASSGYLHVMNCWYALNGANGDNDVLAWMYSHTPYGLTSSGYGGYTRYDSHHVIVWVDYWRYSKWVLNQPGYCVGGDEDIIDKVGSPPAAW